MRSLCAIALSALLPLTALAQSAEDEAGDVAEVDKDARGPLRERVRPVSGARLSMNKRFEISPGFGMSVRNSFFTNYALGGLLEYHLSEIWGIGLRGAYGVNAVAGSAQICTSGQDSGCSRPSAAILRQREAFGDIRTLASIDVEWSPLYGKISFLAEQFLSVNLFVRAGPAIVNYGPRKQWTPGGHIGGGARVYLSKSLALRTELRALFYEEDSLGSKSFRNQLYGDFGLSIFLPSVR